ncbi:unnamed protein product [Phytomonas sp. Hart1]|nr:unnamed protein product [Phytomonas sp. Hart1]|eukprot:CCW69254.1 unnamed protein product [Phytomonas sp. isolate Hart1]
MLLKQITISRVLGPLFLIDEIEEGDSENANDLLLVLQHTYPQFFKKSIGWKLSIEEVEFLILDAPRHSLQVNLKSEFVCAQREHLRCCCPSACTIYQVLTIQHGFLLRHGTQFGALFIGYVDLQHHGEVLFFLGPLSELERVAAKRVARNVGKRAIACECTGREVHLREIMDPQDDLPTLRRRKRRRLDKAKIDS